MDHQDNILYWVDNFYSYIVSFDLNDENAYPKDLTQVVTSGDLFSFDIDPEFGFFVTDIQDNYLHIVPLDLRKTTETIIWQHEVPNGVIFYSDINQPEQSAPCESAGCDQLCASDPSGYRCFCTYGYRLNLDEKTCEPDGSIIYGHDMVFSMEDSGLCTFQPNIGHRQTPERRCFSDYVAEELDLDVYALYVFTVEKTGNVTKIWRLRLETTVPRDYIMQLPSSDVRGIAVDWIASNLYITDAERREILISSLEGSYLTTLVGNDISRPTAIAVHAPKQYLFWTDTGPNPRIERSDLSGRKDRRLLVNTRIQSPTHLVIDMPNDRIYWADGETLLIESMQLDGQKREIFYNYSGLTDNPLFHFTGLAIFQDLLYASETGKTLRVFDKTSNDLIQSINYPGEIKTMKFFHESLQPLAEGPCAVLNEECDEICINTKYGAECVCSTSSCTPVYRCPLTIENGKLLAGCDNRNGHSCDFLCNTGYVRATNESVTCMVLGKWSIGSKELCRPPPRCPLNISNGQMSDSCDNKIGESCNYTCNDGYRPITMDSVTCGDAGEWSIPSEDLCVIFHCLSGPCQNDGKCTDTDDGFNCTCSLQWHGDVCDQQMSGTTGGSNGVVIAVTLVVIVLVITAIVVLVLFRRRILQKSGDSDTPFDDVFVRNKSVENAYSGAPTAPPASAPAAPTAPPASAPAAPMQSGRQTILELKVRSVEGPPQQWNVVADDPMSRLFSQLTTIPTRQPQLTITITPMTFRQTPVIMTIMPRQLKCSPTVSRTKVWTKQTEMVLVIIL
ncbi:pro-epidermal growth factor-like [Ptychodera flava]|uniref:pro-epidermal growth factor-like n=1 Tax=Ptychodera flava TaxID=63121 RepID=UPI00396A8F3A